MKDIPRGDGVVPPLPFLPGFPCVPEEPRLATPPPTPPHRRMLKERAQESRPIPTEDPSPPLGGRGEHFHLLCEGRPEAVDGSSREFLFPLYR
jgi:hypothetical protein